MESNEISLKEALQSLREIKRAIERVDGADAKSPSRSSARQISLVMQGGAALCAGAFLISDLVDGKETMLLLASSYDSYVRLSGIVGMAAILAFLLGCLYFILWQAAKRSNESLNDYIARNFSYIANLSLGADLFVKFIVLSAIVQAGKPEWFGPLLLIFTGDYLLQGRLFTLPISIAAILGLACFGGGVGQALNGSPSLVPCLATFVIISLLSILWTVRSDRVTKSV